MELSYFGLRITLRVFFGDRTLSFAVFYCDLCGLCNFGVIVARFDDDKSAPIVARLRECARARQFFAVFTRPIDAAQWRDRSITPVCRLQFDRDKHKYNAKMDLNRLLCTANAVQARDTAAPNSAPPTHNDAARRASLDNSARHSANAGSDARAPSPLDEKTAIDHTSLLLALLDNQQQHSGGSASLSRDASRSLLPQPAFGAASSHDDATHPSTNK
jgi:hypothetical protein